MTRLARAGEGNTFFVTSADDLSRIFKIELGDVGNVVARKIGVDIRFPEGVRPIRILGREGRVARDRVFLEFTQVYGHMPKHALIEVAIDPGSSDASREIAVAEVNYRCGVDNEFRQVVARVNARFSASKSVVQNSANIEVMRDLAESLIAVAKDEVVEMMDRGEKTAAVSRLGALKEEIDGWNAQLRDEKLEEQSAVLAQEAAELEIHGMDNAKRKAYRTESYQSSNSQYAY
jgi:Ca-activated chloride channel family protein